MAYDNSEEAFNFYSGKTFERKFEEFRSRERNNIKLFAFIGLHESRYFDTKKKLEEYLNNNNDIQGNICTIEYIGTFHDQDDVIKITDTNSIGLYSIIDNNGYIKYNEDESIINKKNVWEYNYGNIFEMYFELKKRGVKFKKDIYDNTNSHQLVRTKYHMQRI